VPFCYREVPGAINATAVSSAGVTNIERACRFLAIDILAPWRVVRATRGLDPKNGPGCTTKMFGFDL
jgi:hypothetical protein